MRKLAAGIGLAILFFCMAGPDVIGVPRSIKGQWAREQEQLQCLQDELTFMEFSAAILEETQSSQEPGDSGSCGERSSEVTQMPDDRPAQRSEVCDEDVDLLARLLACEIGCSWIPDEQQLCRLCGVKPDGLAAVSGYAAGGYLSARPVCAGHFRVDRDGPAG